MKTYVVYNRYLFGRQIHYMELLSVDVLLKLDRWRATKVRVYNSEEEAETDLKERRSWKYGN